MKNINTKALVDSAIMIAISAVMILLSLYVPFFAFLGIFVSSVPLALITVKHGIKTALTSSVALLLLLCILTAEPISMAVLFFLMIIPGIVSGICIKNEKNFFFTLVSIILCVVVSFIINIQIMDILYGDDFILHSITEYADTFGSVLKTRLDTALNSEATDLLKTEGLENFDVDVFTNQITVQMVNMFTLYFPAMLIIISFVIGYFILKVNAFFIKKLRVKEYRNNLPFVYFTVPKSVVYVMFILDLLMLFSGSDSDSLVISAFMNMETVLTFIVFVCGLAFIEFHFRRFVPQRWIRTIVYGVAIVGGSIFMSVLTYIIQLIGIFDILFGFRRYLVNQNMQS